MNDVVNHGEYGNDEDEVPRQRVGEQIRFTQEQLVQAYQQMIEERHAEEVEAGVVALELCNTTDLTVGTRKRGAEYGFQSVGPNPDVYELCVMLCQYDNWDKTIALLEVQGVTMQPWNRTYANPPIGEYVSSTNQKTYTLKIEFYDAHANGF